MGTLNHVRLAPAVWDCLRTFSDVAQELDLDLAGQAGSGRKYYRLQLAGRSWVLQQSHAGDADFHRFVDYCELFALLGLSTPRIHAVDLENFQVLLDDLGTTQLWDHCHQKAAGSNLPPQAEPCAELYRRVLAELTRWQSASPGAFASNADLRSREFDFAALRWETNYFTEHYLQGYCGLTTSIADLWSLVFDQLAEHVAAHPRGLMHRDFQSQNVMVDITGRIGFVDFQGARHGSLYYDAASLLWDPYVRSDSASVRTWFLEWVAHNPNLPVADISVHWKCFLEASLQRLMQAMGAYCNLSRNKGITAFAKHIAPGRIRILQVLDLYEMTTDPLNLHGLRAYLGDR